MYVGERNIDEDKSAYKSKESGEQHKLIVPRHIQEEGQDAIKKYLDDLFSNALFGSDLTLMRQNHEAHQSNSNKLDRKTHIKQEAKSLYSFVNFINEVCLRKLILRDFYNRKRKLKVKSGEMSVFR